MDENESNIETDSIVTPISSCSHCTDSWSSPFCSSLRAEEKESSYIFSHIFSQYIPVFQQRVQWMQAAHGQGISCDLYREMHYLTADKQNSAVTLIGGTVRQRDHLSQGMEWQFFSASSNIFNRKFAFAALASYMPHTAAGRKHGMALSVLT